MRIELKFDHKRKEPYIELVEPSGFNKRSDELSGYFFDQARKRGIHLEYYDDFEDTMSIKLGKK